MKKSESRHTGVRIEVVTATFVASGQPEGIHDLGRFIDNLNNTQLSHHITLMAAAVRPLYRATDQLHLDAPLLVKRDEIVFTNFEGPTFPQDESPALQIEAPVLLLAPPFQIQGTVAFAPGSDPALALRSVVGGFFVVRKASVFDADGNSLGEGEQIIVNGAAVQMTAATRRHIDVAPPLPSSEAAATAAADVEDDEPARRAA
jgi:hypothetical protein